MLSSLGGSSHFKLAVSRWRRVPGEGIFFKNSSGGIGDEVWRRHAEFSNSGVEDIISGWSWNLKETPKLDVVTPRLCFASVTSHRLWLFQPTKLSQHV